MKQTTEKTLTAVPLVIEGNRAITTMEMLQSAVQAGANPETLEKLMALHERWEANQARKAFDNAMSAAKAEIPVISKNRTVDFTSAKGRTNYDYEDLGEIARTIDGVLSKYGLSYRWETDNPEPNLIRVTCVISHRDGHSVSNSLIAPRDDTGNKNPIQGIGSTVTFLQRYTLKSGVGLAAAKDDDGKAAGQRQISEAQLAELQRIALANDVDIIKFCKTFELESLADIAPADFQKAKTAMMSKRKPA